MNQESILENQISQVNDEFQQWVQQQQNEIFHTKQQILSSKSTFDEKVKELLQKKHQIEDQLKQIGYQKKAIYADLSKCKSENEKLYGEIQKLSHDFDLLDNQIEIMHKKKTFLQNQLSQCSASAKEQLEVYEILYGLRFEIFIQDNLRILKVLSMNRNSYITFKMDGKNLQLNESESDLNFIHGNNLNETKLKIQSAISDFNKEMKWPPLLLCLQTILNQT